MRFTCCARPAAPTRAGGRDVPRAGPLAMRGGRVKRGRGQWCWACQTTKPNEAFSGGNHGRHLCRACASARRREARATREGGARGCRCRTRARRRHGITWCVRHRAPGAQSRRRAGSPADRADDELASEVIPPRLRSPHDRTRSRGARGRTHCLTTSAAILPSSSCQAYLPIPSGSPSWSAERDEPTRIPLTAKHGRWSNRRSPSTWTRRPSKRSLMRRPGGASARGCASPKAHRVCSTEHPVA